MAGNFTRARRRSRQFRPVLDGDSLRLEGRQLLTVDPSVFLAPAVTGIWNRAKTYIAYNQGGGDNNSGTTTIGGTNTTGGGSDTWSQTTTTNDTSSSSGYPGSSGFRWNLETKVTIASSDN